MELSPPFAVKSRCIAQQHAALRLVGASLRFTLVWPKAIGGFLSVSHVPDPFMGRRGLAYQTLRLLLHGELYRQRLVSCHPTIRGLERGENRRVLGRLRHRSRSA